VSELAGYGQAATARRVPEPAKAAQASGAFARSPFERDRARVLHTSALRRLAAKTQVVEIGTGDFPRTRLTHSLECAQIGRELGAAIGCDPDLVDAACLAHDLGHPPFGHNGEAVLAELAAPCGGFEGNAQTLRLLTRLEAKVPGAGLNLTRATLDATIKYPWGRRPGTPGAPAAAAAPGDDLPYPAGKYNYYADDAEAFRWLRDGALSGRRCLEAQVMDWADDVAYSVHDLEDGLHAGLITLPALGDPAHRAAVTELTAVLYCAPGSAGPAELDEVFGALLALPFWPGRFDGSQQSLAGLKNLTSELIGRLCGAVQAATAAANSGSRHPGPGSGGRPPHTPPAGHGSGGRPPHTPALTRYAADLVVPRRQRLECALLKGVTAHFVMSRDRHAEVQARQRELIIELAAAVQAGAPETLDPAFRPDFAAAGSDAARLRVIIDQLASLTDTSAHSWHRRLCQ
jgi:dGTPase